MSSESLARLWRQLHAGDNPLVRRWDRAENCLLVSFAVLALLAVPVLAAIGSTVHAQQLTIVADQQASRVSGVAVLLDNASPPSATGRGTPGRVEVRASWVSPGGALREGEVPAPYGAEKGTKVAVWLDSNGNLATRPLTHMEALALAIGAAAAAWLAFVSVLAMVFRGARALLNRARYAEWDREWLHIARDSIGP